MPVEPVTATGGMYTAAPTRAPKQQLDGEVFLSLLVTQLRNQDPSSPMDTTQMIAQTTQLAMMEELTSISAAQQESFGLQMRSAAADLIGRQISYTDAAGLPASGVVTAVSYAGQTPTVTVNGQDVALDSVGAVTSAGGPAAVSSVQAAGGNYGAASVAGYSGNQLANADAIVAAGRAMGLSERDVTIGVMTAMGESGLQVIDHGDAAGPDSRGLFQQRDNGAWGTYAERMDPTASATSFFTALAGIGGRDAMTPTAVAHAVQRNADPNHYEKYWPAAVEVVQTLTASQV
ncbi:flagellar hook assembly protein FlgD [Georgenia sp. AZ-5]|uniref:flagellar hook assembly protein FlgD n=1 Tax=Georgenia sp. AZ-5 TaxID=3367526 RepID=UPI003754D673